MRINLCIFGINFSGFAKKDFIVSSTGNSSNEKEAGLSNSNNLFKKKIMEVATKNPNWISENATALFAINNLIITAFYLPQPLYIASIKI